MRGKVTLDVLHRSPDVATSLDATSHSKLHDRLALANVVALRILIEVEVEVISR